MTGRFPLSSRLLQSPRVGFALTTTALVALASGTTGILVSHGASQLQPVVPHVVPPRSPSPPATPVLVERAPGSLLPHAVTGVPHPVRPAPPARVVDVTPTAPIVVPVPVVEPPVVTPPVLGPPVVDPGVVEPPVVGGPIVEPNTKPGRRAHPPHPDDNGKHLGQLKH